MEKLTQIGSLKTPSINFDPDEGLIEIKGKSIPENAAEFYEPLYDWLDRYAADPKENTTVKLYMEYFNTSSSKEFMRFFSKLEAIHTSGNTNMNVFWYYEEDDEEMMEMGMSLEQRVEIPMSVKSFEEL